MANDKILRSRSLSTLSEENTSLNDNCNIITRNYIISNKNYTIETYFKCNNLTHKLYVNINDVLNFRITLNMFTQDGYNPLYHLEIKNNSISKIETDIPYINNLIKQYYDKSDFFKKYLQNLKYVDINIINELTQKFY